MAERTAKWVNKKKVLGSSIRMMAEMYSDIPAPYRVVDSKR